MAKRKNELAGKLGGSSSAESRPGWRDTILTGQQPVDPPQSTLNEPVAQPTKARKSKPADQNKPVRKTYLLQPQIIERIENTAEIERVGISELTNFLLSTALDLIESGQIEIPTQTAKRKIV